VLVTRFTALLLVPAFLSTIARAQYNTATYCNAGLRPDGYVDFTDLPPAPNFPAAKNGLLNPSAPIALTLPVHGIPGLSVQLTIPTLTEPQAPTVYTAASGVLALNGNLGGNGMQLQFSQPVAGVGVIATTSGRSANFSLTTTASNASSPGPPNFVNNSSTDTVPPHYFTFPLEAVATRGSSFALATISAAPVAASFADLRVQSTAADSTSENTVPLDGLEMWLKSESAESQYALGASAWPDQSGKGHDATQTVTANQPGQVEADGNNCQGAFSFAGNQFFNFNLPIDGWEEMTVFIVGKSFVDPPASTPAAYSAGILWNENAPWGNTFVTPYQKSVVFSFGTTQQRNESIYTRPANIGQDLTITRAAHNGSTDSLYIDGQLVQSKANKLPVLGGATAAGFIGRGINNTYFTGEISEILVYDRVLTTSEASQVEFYLRDKFGTR
jgi:hypothetical protein